MDQIIQMFFALLPEFVLAGAACLLFLIGTANSAQYRRGAAILALITVSLVFLQQLIGHGFLQLFNDAGAGNVITDPWNSVRVTEFSSFVKLIASGMVILLILLAWPTNSEATGGNAFEVGHELAEFYGLMLLSLCGVFIVASANDIILLFLGLELASIPTYIMVSISRPIPVAQEAGVKYFFLGAMSAAVMLFGFSYLYGTTGLLKLDAIAEQFQLAYQASGGALAAMGSLTTWQVLAVLMLLAGFAFKIAAVPLHSYAGDVYTGAATPVTAFLAFVPKTSGFIAIIKLLYVVGGADWAVPDVLVKLLWIVAVLTMTFGNVLALLASNVKRVLAYSSVAHSGYMLVGLTALVSARGNPEVQSLALQGVLFYLVAYGVMNIGAFGVLSLIPARFHYTSTADTAANHPPATTAETYEDLAGQGRRHIGLGLALALCCFSLTGLPLTVGFFGKLYLVQPALDLGGPAMNWLVVIVMINAAISAGYYLKIIGTMFLRPDPHGPTVHGHATALPQMPLDARATPVMVAVALAAVGVMLAGAVPRAHNALGDRVKRAIAIDPVPPVPVAEAAAVSLQSPAGR
ncbi:MAG TPA: NADH-quinone oxidoreductase subunit N [Tepidisphaeraceae bacterium]|jgi:NADH-quinone oxidoreductase subunit N|nr:NADH-quinone oxidoreductase subunit N [Tepidisphaeraceae bacterium]